MAIMKQILDYIFSGDVSTEPLVTSSGSFFYSWGSKCVPPLLICCGSYPFGTDHSERGDHPGHGAGVGHAPHDRPQEPVLPVLGELHRRGELHRYPSLLAALLPLPRPLRRHRVPADALRRRVAHRGVQGVAAEPPLRAAGHGEAERGQREARAGGRGALVRTRPGGAQGGFNVKV